MPVSKRDKKVSLTKVSKKGKKLKRDVTEVIQKSLETYNSIFVFTTQNMRNEALKELREDWRSDSRFMLAKRKVMQKALGCTQAEEVRKNLHQLSSLLQGQCGLLFTNKPKDTVIQFFRDYSKRGAAKSGFVATETVKLSAGPLDQFDGAMEPHLRTKLNLPTQLVKGKIMLREDFTVCTSGTRLKPEQADLLKKLGNEMAEFKVHLVCYWSNDGSFEILKAPKIVKKTPQKSEGSNRDKTPKQKKGTPKQEGKPSQTPPSKPQNGNTPKAKPTTPKPQTPKEKIKTPNKVQEVSMQVDEDSDGVSAGENDKFNQIISAKQEKSTPSQKVPTPKPLSQTPKQKLNTPKKVKQTPMQVEEESDEDEASSDQITPSKQGKLNPRRSMRTKKPLRRTPEQKNVSVKKLTNSARKQNATPNKGTPKKTVGTPARRSFKPQKQVDDK